MKSGNPYFFAEKKIETAWDMLGQSRINQSKPFLKKYPQSQQISWAFCFFVMEFMP
jgi:hypothetical protein